MTRFAIIFRYNHAKNVQRKEEIDFEVRLRIGKISSESSFARMTQPVLQTWHDGKALETRFASKKCPTSDVRGMVVQNFL